jgi:hypothetical protein
VIHVVIGCDRDAGAHGTCAAQIRVFHADTLDAAVQAATDVGWSRTSTGKIECPRHGHNTITNGPRIISVADRHAPP